MIRIMVVDWTKISCLLKFLEVLVWVKHGFWFPSFLVPHFVLNNRQEENGIYFVLQCFLITSLDKKQHAFLFHPPARLTALISHSLWLRGFFTHFEHCNRTFQKKIIKICHNPDVNLVSNASAQFVVLAWEGCHSLRLAKVEGKRVIITTSWRWGQPQKYKMMGLAM